MNDYYNSNPQSYDYNGPDVPYHPPGSPAMATAALVLGICSILFSLTGLGLILGAIGIVLALLSRGKGQMNTSAKVGLGLSAGGAVLGVIIMLGSLLFITHSITKTDWDDFSDYVYEYDAGDQDGTENFFSGIL